MKKYIGLIACLAVLLTFQTASDAKPDKPGHGPKPPAYSKSNHRPHPPRHHDSHIRIHYNYSRPCHAHYRYNCYDCCHRPPRGFFGSGLGFTIFL